MTASIAEPRPQLARRPVLRRLMDILPAEVPVTCEPPLVVTTPLVADPAASVRAERVVRAIVEILGGRRSARQLSTMMCPEVLAQFGALQRSAGHLKPRVHKVLVHQQDPGVIEAVGVVTLSTGVRAMAARFEKPVHGERQQWRCTALQLRLTAGDLRRDRRTRQP